MMKRKQRENKSNNPKTKEYTIITYLFFLLFIGMAAYYVFFMFFRSENFINSPYNALQNLFAEHVVRGDIVSSDGETLATTKVDEDLNEHREYPHDEMFAHVIGYATNGKAGLENQMNFSLLRSHTFFVDQMINDFSNQKNDGDTVVSSLNYQLQKAAYYALDDADGAVIVMEPKTGRILAMVSKPDYNPNTIEKNWEKINEGTSSELVNRVTQGQYAPGSVFKIFTTVEFYRENLNGLKNYEFECNGSFTAGGKTIHCASNQSHGKENLEMSFANSCNASYANISLQLDPDAFQSTLDDMLFNKDLPIAFESNKSVVSISSQDGKNMIMDTAIGQGKTYVSPLHMAMIISALDNDGTVMRPYLVDKITNKSGVTVRNYKPQKYKTIFSEDECELFHDYLDAVISHGTAKMFIGQSYDVYGKTGTAQVSDSTDQVNSWFVAYAQQKGYEDIAIAVVVEDSGKVGLTGTRVAKKIFDAYYK